MVMKCPKCHSENPETKQFCADCGTQLIPPEGPQVSKTLTMETQAEELTRGTVFAGRYEILEELGTGGMGSVYRVFDRKLEEEVALKLIRADITAGRKTIERFKNEIKVARKIAHPNVCRMHDLHEEEKTLYITMEYVRGEDLKSVIHRMGTLTMGKAVSIAKQVSEGLAEAHKLGIIHRDLKPGNIMIDKEGNAKIMDFGIARTLAGIGTTAEGVMIGTPEYMSPEQVEGKPADARSDLYSLGVILFEMVTGRAPFEGETPFSIANKQKTEPPPIPKKLVPQIPEGLNKTILRCLEKDKAKRYQTTEELISDLSVAELALPVTDRAFPRAKTRAKTSREITVKFTPKKLLIPVGVLLIVAAIIIVISKFLPRKEAPASSSGPPAVAILYFKNNTGDKDLDIWREGLSISLTTKLSQSRYIRVLDQSQIYSILKRLNLLGQDSFTPEDLKEIGSRGLATHIVRGSLSKAGERFRVDLTLQSASTLEIIAPESADGIGEESLFAMVDGLAERLKTKLGLTAQQAATDVSRDIRDVTTNSIEAFKVYVQGCQVMLTAPFDQSIISCFDRAVAADPQFALAYLKLAQNYWGTGRVKESRLNIQKAFDLREQVSERERLLIVAEYYQYTSETTWDKAIDAFSKLIDLYPWDLFANTELGNLFLYIEEWEKIIERYEVLRANRAEDVSIYQFLAWSYLAEGRSNKAREVLEGYLNTMAENDLIRANLGMVYCILEDFEKARYEIEKAYSRPQEQSDRYYKLLYLLSIRDFAAVETLANEWKADMEQFPNAVPNIGARSISFALQGKINDASRNFGREIEGWRGKLDPRILGQAARDFATLLEKTGDLPGALSACETGLRESREVGEVWLKCAALYRRGIIQARQGNLEEALRSAEELRQVVEKGPVKKRIRHYEGLLGLIALRKGDTSLAPDHLQKALSLTAIESPLSLERPELLDFQAEALEQSGRLRDAQRAYLEIQSNKSLFLSAGSTLVFARSIYKLGKVLESMGDKASAAAKYREFLELWKNADPGLPEVEDARKRLEGLQGKS